MCCLKWTVKPPNLVINSAQRVSALFLFGSSLAFLPHLRSQTVHAFTWGIAAVSLMPPTPSFSLIFVSWSDTVTSSRREMNLMMCFYFHISLGETHKHYFFCSPTSRSARLHLTHAANSLNASVYACKATLVSILCSPAAALFSSDAVVFFFLFSFQCTFI